MFSDPLGLYGSEKKAERKRKKAEKAGWVTSPTHNTNGEWTFQVSDPVDFNNTRLVWDENKFDMSPYAQQHGAISEFKPDFYDKWGASKNFFGKLSYSIFDDASVFFSAVSPFREAQHLDGQSANANEATRAMAGLGTQFLFPAKGATGVLGIIENGADDVIKNAANLLSVTKAVNSNLPHAIERAVERGVFVDKKTAAEAFKNLSSQITQKGFPIDAILDPAHIDRVLVPIGNNGMAVYKVAKNGTASLQTTLIAK